MSTEEFKHESLQDKESIVEYFNALSEGFSKGRLAFANKEKQIIFEPKGLLKLDVKAKRKNDKVKFSLKVSWKEEAIDKKKDTGSLVIGLKDE
ncbi:MAG TPA: amphi-Trp domain-containing protein [Spirochaetes bacterium]|nr:amphi-Trp domain-containing protein [Spirochaetota bacterium]